MSGVPACGAEAHQLAPVGLSSKCLERRRVDRYIWDNGCHSHVILRKFIHQLSCKAAAQIEELCWKTVYIQKNCLHFSFHATLDNRSWIERMACIKLNIGWQ